MVAKNETVNEFKRGVQNIFSLIGEKKILKIYLEYKDLTWSLKVWMRKTIGFRMK